MIECGSLGTTEKKFHFHMIMLVKYGRLLSIPAAHPPHIQQVFASEPKLLNSMSRRFTEF